MDTVQVVMGSIIGLIAVLLGVYVSFTARGKGPILSNSYIFTSDEEKKRMDIKGEYRLVTIIFGCLTGIFSLLSLFIFTELKFILALMWILIIFVTVYAIVDTIKSEKNKK